MKGIPLDKLAAHLDRLLRAPALHDYDDAVNGLQCENRSGRVTKIAAAVDATEFTVKAAIHAKADLLLAHHGLFWSKPQPWTGRHFRKLRALVEGNLAVYASHLPLDAHPKFGNNILIARGLGLTRLEPFLEHHGAPIGWRGVLPHPMSAEELGARIARVVRLDDALKTLPFGPARLRTVGVCSGGASSELKAAASAGVDAYLTGEGGHAAFGDAEELGITVFFAGHYATETFGVRALAEKVARKFHLPCMFVDHPSGL
ncbi:MAG: Nif3-like dinuclear metal center hexameric protein [Verrucomicrobia bacterium]|nr:Nif3-like dinuclear metal center hexameric protein [Verrucomicrobiota bacterium]